MASANGGGMEFVKDHPNGEMFGDMQDRVREVV